VASPPETPSGAGGGERANRERTRDHNRTNAILDATVLVSAFRTPPGARNEPLRHGWRGALILCRSEEVLEEKRRVLLVFQEHRMESEVGNALEPICVHLSYSL